MRKESLERKCKEKVQNLPSDECTLEYNKKKVSPNWCSATCQIKPD